MKDFLPEIVGQNSPKARINFYLENYPKTKMIGNIFIGGPKGSGKTLLAREISKQLIEYSETGEIIISEKTGKPKKKTFLEINAASVKNLRQLIEDVFINYVQGRAVSCFIDEISELPKDCVMGLLTMLAPNKENKTTFSYRDFIIDLDFTRQNFILASSEPQRVFHALLDRLTRIDMDPYSINDLAKILLKQLPDVEFEKGLPMDIATVVRENPRNMVMFATRDLFTFLAGKKKMNFKDWDVCKKILSIFPLGLNTQEINILKLLRDIGGGTSLTALAARTGLSRGALQRDSELYLLRHNLMAIEQGMGRIITSKGHEYLKSIEA